MKQVNYDASTATITLGYESVVQVVCQLHATRLDVDASVYLRQRVVAFIVIGDSMLDCL
jgi:hypothetical protein